MAERTAPKGLTDHIYEGVMGVVDDARDYLASPQGRQMRKRVATGLIVAAPMLARMPFVNASRLGRLVGFAGGAALIVKAAELIRDWEPEPQAARVVTD